jgi:hypothetical protein
MSFDAGGAVGGLDVLGAAARGARVAGEPQLHPSTRHAIAHGAAVVRIATIVGITTARRNHAFHCRM